MGSKVKDPISCELSKHINARQLKTKRFAQKTLMSAYFMKSLVLIDFILLVFYTYSFIDDCLDGSPGWAIYHAFFAAWFTRLLHQAIKHYRQTHG